MRGNARLAHSPHGDTLARCAPIAIALAVNCFVVSGSLLVSFCSFVKCFQKLLTSNPPYFHNPIIVKTFQNCNFLKRTCRNMKNIQTDSSSLHLFTWLGLALHGNCDGVTFSCEARRKGDELTRHHIVGCYCKFCQWNIIIRGTAHLAWGRC